MPDTNTIPILRVAFQRGAKLDCQTNQQGTTLEVVYRNDTYEVTSAVRELIGGIVGRLGWTISNEWLEAEATKCDMVGDECEMLRAKLEKLLGVDVHLAANGDIEYLANELEL